MATNGASNGTAKADETDEKDDIGSVLLESAKDIWFQSLGIFFDKPWDEVFQPLQDFSIGQDKTRELYSKMAQRYFAENEKGKVVEFEQTKFPGLMYVPTSGKTSTE